MFLRSFVKNNLLFRIMDPLKLKYPIFLTHIAETAKPAYSLRPPIGHPAKRHAMAFRWLADFGPLLFWDIVI